MVALDETKFDEQMTCFYAEKLPKKYRLAVLEDFFVSHKCYEKRHKKKLGMQYLVLSKEDGRYYIREVHELLLDVDLIPFIEQEMVYIDPADVLLYTNKVLSEPKDFDVTEWATK